MSTKNSSLFLVSVISLCVLIAFLFLITYISNKNKLKPIEVLVASQDIPSGIFIKPEMVVKMKCPAYLTNYDDIKDLQEVAGLITLAPIPKGKPIVYNQFSPSEKAQAPIQSHNPTNFILAVDDNSRSGKLLKQRTNYSFTGKFNWDKYDAPLANFPKVKFIYLDSQPIKPFGYAQKSINLFSVTQIQAEKLKALTGKSICLALKGISGDEIMDISELKDY